MPASPPSVEAVAAFVEKIHIFYGISEDNLFDICERLEDKSVKAGEVILDAGQASESFYIIYAGKVDILRENKGQRRSRFSQGDYFGEDVFFEGDKRDTKIVAKTDALLLELPKNLFAEIPDAVNFLRNQLEAFLACRALTESVNFDWIEEDEAIYFVTNKHPILFWQRAPIPILLLVGGPILIFWGMWVGALFPLIFSVLGFVVGFFWLLWNWLDFGNDYYIVTNQRVIWLEKIIGVFDSRQEAHLSEIKSVQAETDVFVQSMFDYGHITVNTIFGGIELNYIPYPRQAHLLIEELWQRSQIDEKRKAKDRLHQAIRDQIKQAQAVAEKKRRPPLTPSAAVPQKTLPSMLFKKKKTPKKKKKKGYLFTLRYQEGKDIIYRKHIVVLLTQAGAPTLLSFVIAVYFFIQLYLFARGFTSLPISYILLIGLGLIGTIGWSIYQYIDWSNDIFKISEDKIFDIDRKPFSNEQSRSSELKNMAL